MTGEPETDDVVMVPHSVMVSQINAAVHTAIEQCARIAQDYGRLVPAAGVYADRIADSIRQEHLV